jgi:transposase-like protein
MKKSRYREEQMVGILKESEAGVETGELCRKHGISQQTFYRWKAAECSERHTLAGYKFLKTFSFFVSTTAVTAVTTESDSVCTV